MTAKKSYKSFKMPLVFSNQPCNELIILKILVIMVRIMCLFETIQNNDQDNSIH